MVSSLTINLDHFSEFEIIIPHPLGKKTPYRFLRHSLGRAHAGKSIYKVKQSGFNVSSAYVLKSDMDRCSPVDAVM